MIRRNILATIAASLLLGCGSLRAEPVSLRFGDTELLGELRVSSAGGLADGVTVLLHGTLAHHGMEIIDTLQTLLAERGRNTLAITLSLGLSGRTGMYDCKTAHRHLMTDAVAEIRAWTAWLKTEGAGPVTLVGHSRGGNQAARFAIADAPALQALVLIAPATLDAERARRAYGTHAGAGLDQTLARARAAAPDDWLDDTPFLYCGPSRVTAQSFLSYYSDDGLQDTPSLLPRITTPTLVIAGGADTTVPDVVERTRPHVDADTRLVVIDGADHFFRDLYAEDLADAITAFLEQQGT